MTGELRIHTQINSRYRVLDLSGQLPFSIIFGFCRRSPADTDPRPLLLETAGSILDVSYALGRGLLILYEQDPKDQEWVEVDLSRLNKVTVKEAECLSLPSPVNRTEHWRDAFATYQYHIDVGGELASILIPGKKYRIRLASKDLGVNRWTYSDRTQFLGNDGRLSNDSEAVKLVNSKSTASNATFKVMRKLPLPPRTETRIRLCASSPVSDFALADTARSGSTALEISVLNTSSFPVTVQTRGHQSFLHRWGIFEPESDDDDDCARIIDSTTPHPPTSSLQVIDAATGKVALEQKRLGVCRLKDSNIDRRPKLEDVVTLKPGEPKIKRFDIGTLVGNLVDGRYKIRMLSRGCRWWHGKIGKEECENGRVPERFGGVFIPPLMLESQDEVEIRLMHGKVDQSL
ncbi:MAG: hypothetical protein Q9216_002736 [Gyalolechia sp. 2 TL-2023]